MKLLILFLSCLAIANGAKILCFFPVPSPSVAIIAHRPMIELAKRGHQVTMVSMHPSGIDMPNFLEIILPMPKERKELLKDVTLGGFGMKNPFKIIHKFVGMSTAGAKLAFLNPEIKYLMENGTFDLVVSSFAMATFQQGIAAHFNCPYVLLSSIPAARPMLEMVGQGANPEAVPSFFLGFKDPMTMWERVMNMGAAGFEYLMHVYVDFVNAKLYEEYFPSPRYPRYADMKTNVSLIMVNSHFSLNSPRPLLPNLIEVGGVQIKNKPDPLPEDIQKWIDGAEHGVIFVSFGSNVQSSDLPAEKIEILLKTFSSLKQRVIWKFESNRVPKLPSNVLVKKWLPQDDILANSKTQLFISHCGLSSYNEALFHAVPIVGIPFGGDQPLNAQKGKDEGWAEFIPNIELTQEGLDSAVKKVLADPKYKNAVKRLSELYRDRPMSALDTAIYWIEYVLRHNGAPHLHYQGAELNFFQKTSFDVWSFILAWIYILAKGVMFSLKKVVSSLFGSKKRAQKQNVSKKSKKNKKD